MKTIQRVARFEYPGEKEKKEKNKKVKDIPEQFYHIPCIVGGTQPTWNIEEWITSDKLRDQFGDLQGIVVDLNNPPEVVEEQRNVFSRVADFFNRRNDGNLVYLTEVYMRNFVYGTNDRPYPRVVFPENWFHTERPSRLESFFLGNKGTYGVIHDDGIYGLGFLYVLSGVKRVIFFPPEAEPKLKEKFGNFRLKHFPLEIPEEDISSILECNGQIAEVRQGELLIIPQAWWHQITNLEDDTFSFVDMILLPDHLVRYCSTPEFDRFSIPHTLEEIIPYRLDLAENFRRDFENSPSVDNRENLVELLDGLEKLQVGLKSLLGNLTVEEQIAHFQKFLEKVTESVANITKSLDSHR